MGVALSDLSPAVNRLQRDAIKTVQSDEVLDHQ